MHFEIDTVCTFYGDALYLQDFYEDALYFQDFYGDALYLQDLLRT